MGTTTEGIMPETPAMEDPAKTDDIEKIIEKTAQSAADRVRTEYSHKLKAAQEEIENLRKEKMTAKERAEYEAAQLRDELDKKSRDLTHREMQLLDTGELERNGLDLSFLDYVIGSDKDATLGKISQLKSMFDAALGKAVESQMKAYGRDPNKGRSGSPETSGFEGMTPKDIQAKARKDPDWWNKNQAEILKATADGKIKR